MSRRGGSRPRPAGRPARSPARRAAPASPRRPPAARSARADRGRDSGSRPERRGLRSRSPARRPGAARRARRRGSPTSPGAQVLAQAAAARRAPAPARDRHRASARGTRRTAPPRRPRASGSSRIMRVNTPSVTTSMRVARETFEPKRTRKPTVSPTVSPSVAAMRSAAARAASRRGSSTMILPARRPRLVEQHQRHPRGLAGAGRRDQHRAIAARSAAVSSRQRLIDRQAAPSIGRSRGVVNLIDPIHATLASSVESARSRLERAPGIPLATSTEANAEPNSGRPERLERA